MEINEIIKENASKALEKAEEINKYVNSLPHVSVGDIARLEDIWDGEGDSPETCYSYLLTEIDNVPVWINYCFEPVPDKDGYVEVTNIELL